MRRLIVGKIITGNQSKIKDMNKQLLFIMIRQYQPISRVEFSEKSGLNKSTVSKLIRELINEGYIKENGRGKSCNTCGSYFSTRTPLCKD